MDVTTRRDAESPDNMWTLLSGIMWVHKLTLSTYWKRVSRSFSSEQTDKGWAMARVKHIKDPEFDALTEKLQQCLDLASQNFATFRNTANIMDWWWHILDAIGADFGNVHDSFDQGACVQARDKTNVGRI